jgi:hypothetical protein
MPLAFPPIRCSTGRILQPGVFPVRRFQGPAGSTTTTIRGDRPYGLPLVLEFNMITDLDAADIWATWHASHGGFREVTLPANALDGIDPALVAQIPANISWYMDGAPEVTSVQPGWSRMQVAFIGRLAMYIVGTAGGDEDAVASGLAWVYAWGAGGAATKRLQRPVDAMLGGVGGYSRGQVPIVSGSTYLIVVGGGGNFSTGEGGFGGGGSATVVASDFDGGAGGGLSGIFLSSFLQANALLIAGGGGGGSGDVANGGRGGKEEGSSGDPSGGFGGTQIAGGTGGAGSPAGQTGLPLQGGAGFYNGTQAGGGGGGGYFGGGGGGSAGPGAGGGGSGYLSPSVENGFTNDRAEDGSLYNPTSLSGVPEDAGLGGYIGESGKNGFVALVDSGGNRFNFSVPGEYYIVGN